MANKYIVDLTAAEQAELCHLMKQGKPSARKVARAHMLLHAAEGATDEEIATWIGEHAKQHARAEIITWNNRMRDLRLSDLPLEAQEFLEDYIPKFVPRGRVVYRWFDVYDLEEKRI